MSQVYKETMPLAQEAVKLGLSALHHDGPLAPKRGQWFLKMWDAKTGKVLEERELDNVITLDAGILAARLFRNSQVPTAGQNNGLRMLAVGTGATGNLLSPDVPQRTQRALNTEITRKAFASVQYRNSNGVAVAYETNIVDFTTTFGEAEAVGALNEMGLLAPYSANPEIKNQISNGPNDYDPTVDVAAMDLMVNYLTFSVISKPSTAILSLTWRLTY